ncbi:uncharacterized protein LOC111640120 [Centruroides sculpturatus]|uniref:uncharacterized protein LOC111640120 n=1 Tax=Centruroides sculpturatus TaxID=218467 RepID=UPI000C6E8B8D|nr:uncharacterized protein LOC111640120 [Centruroides sculpturatus]
MHSLASIARNHWGYGSVACRLLYIAVLEPILIYGSEVWGTSITKVHIRRKLLSAQTLALITITKAYKTAPTDALLAIANLIPIDIVIKEKVWTFHQLQLSTGTVTTNRFNNIISQIGVSPAATCISDHLSKHKLDYNPRHFAHHPSTTIDELFTLGGADAPIGLCIYTDGSKSDAGVGCSVVVANNNRYIHQARFRLASHCTVNQADSLAIYKALLWITENKKAFKITRVTILSDNRVALLQLKKLNTKLSIIQDSINLLLTLPHTVYSSSFPG